MSTAPGQQQHAMLTGLPAELLHRVFDYLDTKGVVAVRQVCRVLGDVGAEHLMDTAHVFYASSSFKELEAVAEHPLIGPRIRRLCYHGDKLRPCHDLESYISGQGEQHPMLGYQQDHFTRDRFFRFMSPHLRQKEVELDAEMERLDCQFHRHKELYEEQQAITSSEADVQALINALKRCPKINTLRLSYSDETYRRRAGQKGYLRAFPQKVLRPDGDADPMYAGAEDLSAACSAFAQADRKLRTLTALNLGVAVFSDDERDLNAVRQVCEDLHHLRLSFTFDGLDGESMADALPGWHEEDLYEYGVHCFLKSVLPDLLGCMTELKTMRLAFPLFGRRLGEYLDIVTDLSSVVGQVVWPKLTDIAISYVTTSADCIVDFLLRHKDQLRRLKLSNLTLIPTAGRIEQWEEVFDRLAGQFCQLQKIRLGGRFNVLMADAVGTPETELEIYFHVAYPDPEWIQRPVTERHILRGGTVDWDALAGQIMGEEELNLDDWNLSEADGIQQQSAGYESDESLIDIDDDE